MIRPHDKLFKQIQGSIRVGLFDTVRHQFKTLYEQRNLFMKSGADLVAALLGGGQNLQLRGMYLEFDNSGGAISAPSYDRDSDISYYTSSLGANRDFLRLPLAAQPVFTATDATYTGNQISFFAITAGLRGVNDEQDFQTGSKIYGGALVATPDLDDQSQDFIAARTYWVADAVEKDATHQVAVQWLLTVY